jgi:hypothetical protein
VLESELGPLAGGQRCEGIFGIGLGCIDSEHENTVTATLGAVGAHGIVADVVDGLSDWWSGVELWVVQLWFPVQFTLVMSVLVPLCLGAAWVIDRVVDHRSARSRQDAG